MGKQPGATPTCPATVLGTDDSFRLLVESVKDYAIVMLDPGGHVASWNAGAERIKGYRPDEILGKHFSCFYPAESIERGLPEQELQAAAKEGRFTRACEKPSK
jgi:PAS domain S-box-containing protein